MEMHLYRQMMKGREEMIAALDSKQRSWTNTACVNIIYDGKTHLSINQACHYGLNNDKIGSFAVVSGLMKPHDGKVLDEEEALYFLEWLLNESPYSSTFITKSPEEALYYKATISSSHHPSNLMAAGMVASRRLWEYPEIARFFVDMGKAGVKKDLAYFLAHMLECDFKRKGNASWDQYERGHCSLRADRGARCLLNYLNHNVINPNKLYSERCKYNGYDDMYDSGSFNIANYLRGNFPYQGEVKKAAGLFPADDKGKDKQCSYENIIQGMVEFQHTLLKEIGYEEKKHA